MFTFENQEKADEIIRLFYALNQSDRANMLKRLSFINDSGENEGNITLS